MRGEHEQFVDHVLEHLCHRMKLGEAILCAADITSDPEEVIDLIYPLVTRHIQPEVRYLHAAISDHRLLMNILEYTSAGFGGVQEWTPERIKQVFIDAATTRATSFDLVRAAVTVCILFKPSPLDLIKSMAMLGQEECCRRCKTVTKMVTLALRVS
ncbi:hypothetical protein [Paraburkholderia domus]|jgi:hypothetical protein|uniref:hypothetical protein n=1 Tax=Paraburkholderia domus TaxID=2793075 RepID=UPI00191299DF|nr:hypothetical protein [Paraburkholderia domus]MBK5066201.1 hypothetical protein [Burkholderia sp. R-70199]CAE6968451.1 hypothetical protein R70199_07943 [Paraburkholderia domus]